MGIRPGLLAFAGWCVASLLPVAAQSAEPGSCTLSIAGDGGSQVWINASGCDADTIAITVGGSGGEHQFPGGQGPEISLPFNPSACDLGLPADKPSTVTYTAVVVSGPNRGQASPPYSGTLQPQPAVADAPPTISFSSAFAPGSYVRPGDAISLSVTARDDIGLTRLKLLDPDGHTVVDKKIQPPAAPTGCHARSGQSETVDLPTPYVVPQDPPPVLEFAAEAFDTAGQETTATIAFTTVAFWNGRMIVESKGVTPGEVCATTWNLELWVRTSAQNDVTGTAEGEHSPRLACQYVGGPDPGGSTSFAISGTFDGTLFRLQLKATGGYSAYGVSGLAALEWPSEQTIELKRTNHTSASGPINIVGPGTVGNTATMSAVGEAHLECCYSDPGSSAPAKTAPIFLGEGDK